MRRHALAALSLTYACALLVWHMAVGNAWAAGWPWQLSQAIGSWFYLPLWLLLVMALLRRNRYAAILLLVPLLLFGFDYGRQYLPRWPRAFAGTDAAERLRVMSWNSYHHNENSAAFQQSVLDLQPDLVAIQEIGTEMAADLPQMLGEYFPYREVYATGGASGMAILSRYPFLTTEPPDIRWRVETCNCQQVTIDVAGQPVTVINMHPWPPRMQFSHWGRFPLMTDYNTANQDPIVQRLLARIDAAESPLLVVGDLNTSERQPNYWRLRVHLRDAFADAGWGLGYTFPSRGRVSGIPLFPFIRIDYVFYDPAWTALSARTGAIDGSDHRYVVADLVLRQ
jgi:endonuclease/exonuclease/phosphatase (EEP) superfamily protein YafD